MSLTKRWLEDISIEMGFEGEITDEVMEEAQSRHEAMQAAIEQWDKQERFKLQYEKD